MRFVLFAQKAAIILLNTVKRLSFVMETPCVFREIETRGLVNICVTVILLGVKEAREENCHLTPTLALKSYEHLYSYWKFQVSS